MKKCVSQGLLLGISSIPLPLKGTEGICSTEAAPMWEPPQWCVHKLQGCHSQRQGQRWHPLEWYAVAVLRAGTLPSLIDSRGPGIASGTQWELNKYFLTHCDMLKWHANS